MAAQTDSTTIRLDKIIVNSNRIQIPFSENSRTINIITREQIANTPAQSIPELLQYVAGVDIRQRGVHGVQADVSIRGGTFDQVLILINGIKMADPQTGHHAMNIPISISNIEHIEVLKGPAARIYGQNAFAGAINIVTKAPEERFTEIQLSAGENNLGGVDIAVSLPQRKYKQFLAFSRNFSEGYRYNTDYDISNYFYQADWDLAPNQNLDILASFTERRFGANRFYGNNSDAFANQYEEVQTGLVGIGYRLIKGNFAFRPRLSWRHNQDEYVFDRSNPSIYRNLHISDVFNLELHGDYYSTLGITGIGAELSRVDLRSNNLGERERTIATLFAEHRFEFWNKKIDLTPGIAFNHYSDFGSYFYPGLELGLQLAPGAKFYANTGYTWRIPTFTDLYYEDRANIGNPDLQPEAALSYEAGVKYSQSWWSAQLSLFQRDGRDLIDWTRDSIGGKWQPLNLTNIQMRGAELSTQIDFKILLGQDAWLERLQLSYTYLDAQDPEFDVPFSRYVLENLKHQFIAGLEHRLFASLHHSLRVRFLDRVTLPDYTLIDSRIYWKAKRWQAFLQVDNLLDRNYFESNLVEMPGRWIHGGVKIRFGKM